MIYPASIKSYRYKDGADYSIAASSPATLVLDGPLVVKSISFNLTRGAGSTSADRGYVEVLDGSSLVVKLGLNGFLSYYPSLCRINLPGAGIRFDTSLVFDVKALFTATSLVCTNINIGYQR